MNPLKMYSLLKMVIFQPAMLVYQRVIPKSQVPDVSENHTQKEPPWNTTTTVNHHEFVSSVVTHYGSMYSIFYLHLVDFNGKLVW